MTKNIATATTFDLTYTRDGNVMLGVQVIGTVQPGETRAAAGRRIIRAAKAEQAAFARWSAATMHSRRRCRCQDCWVSTASRSELDAEVYDQH